MKNPEHQIRTIIDKNEKIVGFSINLITSTEELISELNKYQYASLSSFLTGEKKIGILKMICLIDEFKGKGIGSQLINESLNYFKSKNIQVIYAFAWKNSEGINMGTIFNRYRINRITEIQNFWYDDSLEKNYCCPECGQPPCRCSVVVYGKNV